MKRLLPPWALLLLAAIFVMGVMLWLRVHPLEPEKPEDPLAVAAERLAERPGLEVDAGGEEGGGVRVTGVRPGGRAEQMGFQAGDRIVACGAQSVWHAYQLLDLMTQAAARGQPPVLLVEREGEYWQAVFGAAGPGPSAGPPAHEGGW